MITNYRFRYTACGADKRGKYTVICGKDFTMPGQLRKPGGVTTHDEQSPVSVPWIRVL